MAAVFLKLGQEKKKVLLNSLTPSCSLFSLSKLSEKKVKKVFVRGFAVAIFVVCCCYHRFVVVVE